MLRGPRPDRVRLAEKRADQVEVMNRVHGNLHAVEVLEKRPEAPGREDVDADLHIVNPADGALLDQSARFEHGRREAKLEVYRSCQTFAPANIANCARLFDVPAHRLLDQHYTPAGNCFQQGKDGIWRRRYIEYGVRRRTAKSICRAGINFRYSEFRGDGYGFHSIKVANAVNRKARYTIRRKMGIPNNPAGADDHDRPP